MGKAGFRLGVNLQLAYSTQITGKESRTIGIGFSVLGDPSDHRGRLVRQSRTGIPACPKKQKGRFNLEVRQTLSTDRGLLHFQVESAHKDRLESLSHTKVCPTLRRLLNTNQRGQIVSR